MVYKYSFLITYLLLASILQGTIGEIYGAKPDFILLGILAVSLLRGGKEGVTAGITGGIIEDILIGISGGFFTVAKSCIAVLTLIARTCITADYFIIPIVTGFMGTIIHEALFYVLVNFAHWKTLNFDFKNNIFPTAIVNAVISPIIFLLIRKLVFKEKEIKI